MPAPLPESVLPALLAGIRESVPLAALAGSSLVFIGGFASSNL
jgi:hypothetical protein